jgi:hypothetical protein
VIEPKEHPWRTIPISRVPAKKASLRRTREYPRTKTDVAADDYSRRLNDGFKEILEPDELWEGE